MDHSVKNRMLPNDPLVKCFLHCMFDMFGLVCIVFLKTCKEGIIF